MKYRGENEFKKIINSPSVTCDNFKCPNVYVIAVLKEGMGREPLRYPHPMILVFSTTWIWTEFINSLLLNNIYQK